MKKKILLFIGFILIFNSCIKKVDRNKKKESTPPPATNVCSDTNNIDNSIHISAIKAYNSGDYYKALYLFEKSCAINYTKSCNLLAYFSYSGKIIEENKSKAFDIYFKSCQNKDIIGCFNIANMLRAGEGTEEKNEKLASSLYKSNCRKKHYKSCFNLAVMYYKGKGVKKNIEKAKKLFQKSCGGGIDVGCKNFYLVENKNIKYLPNVE
ncbi:hypothetical protein MNB_SV-15-196 [hydrothermal vent metagenome]|uniref:Beta-lactamase n=1 Tax=hydrothermal vent metagenome TaxID=652676 RepID=A0A1W1EJJ3_9ZZZZ